MICPTPIPSLQIDILTAFCADILLEICAFLQYLLPQHPKDDGIQNTLLTLVHGCFVILLPLVLSNWFLFYSLLLFDLDTKMASNQKNRYQSFFL